MSTCWLCHGWGAVARVDTGETSWADRTGGPGGERFPIYRLEPRFGVMEPGETIDKNLIDCPVCGPGLPETAYTTHSKMNELGAPA